MSYEIIIKGYSEGGDLTFTTCDEEKVRITIDFILNFIKKDS